MRDNLEDVLNVTMKRLQIIMQDAKTALENRTEKLIKSAIALLLDDCTHLERNREIEIWKKLSGYAEELYVQTIIHIPKEGEKDQYLQSYEIMKDILVCERHLAGS